jgi:hypothetical protein
MDIKQPIRWGGVLTGFTYFLFGVSILLFLGTIHYFLASRRPGVYPPRNILRKRSSTLAIGGTLFLMLGTLFYSFI